MHHTFYEGIRKWRLSYKCKVMKIRWKLESIGFEFIDMRPIFLPLLSKPGRRYTKMIDLVENYHRSAEILV